MGCPLVIAGPGIPKGQSPALSYLQDLYPTLCNLAGARLPDSVEGRDLMPVVRGDAGWVRDTLFLAYRGTQRAVRDQRYKLIRFPHIDKTLLFDLQQDPDELHDLSSDPAQQDRVRRLWAQLQESTTCCPNS